MKRRYYMAFEVSTQKVVGVSNKDCTTAMKNVEFLELYRLDSNPSLQKIIFGDFHDRADWNIIDSKNLQYYIVIIDNEEIKEYDEYEESMNKCNIKRVKELLQFFENIYAKKLVESNGMTLERKKSFIEKVMMLFGA